MIALAIISALPARWKHAPRDVSASIMRRVRRETRSNPVSLAELEARCLAIVRREYR